MAAPGVPVRMGDKILERWKSWQILFFFAFLQCGLTGLGVYFFDFFAGTATAGFGRTGAVGGTGMFFIYMLGFLNALVVLIPVLRLGFIGAGVMVYSLWALVGLPLEYHYEWVLNRSLRGLWAVAAWCAAGPLNGLAADLAHRFLPRSIAPGLRAALVGAVLGAACYATTLAALAFLYVVPLDRGPGAFAGLTYFGLPWLVAHSALGGFTAWALTRPRLP
jgi:hypothetical protein